MFVGLALSEYWLRMADRHCVIVLIVTVKRSIQGEIGFIPILLECLRGVKIGSNLVSPENGNPIYVWGTHLHGLELERKMCQWWMKQPAVCVETLLFHQWMRLGNP